MVVTQAIVTLENLHRIDLLNGTSEPYIWPFLGIVKNFSFESTPTTAILADSRNVIKNKMHAGDIAPIPYPLNTLTANFQDDQTNRQLLLVVGLWEQNDTPASAVQAGYQAFLDELNVQISTHLYALSQADDAQQKIIIENIKKSVYDKVYSAEEGQLSTWEKTQVYLGFLNLDDFDGSDFNLFPDLTPTSFTLSLKGLISEMSTWIGPPTITLPNEYEISGSLKIQSLLVNICQAEIDAVAAAQDVLKGLQKQVQDLQNRLQNARPQDKAGINASIDQINNDQIPPAKKALSIATAALEKCQASHSHLPGGPPVSR